MRVTGLPEEVTFVFSSVWHNDNRLSVLREFQVEAIMQSFHYIRGHEAKFKEFETLIDWPTRRYLDSGLFTLMRSLGVHRIRAKQGQQKVANPKKAIRQLKKQFIAYLKDNQEAWDHIVEIDCDNINHEWGPLLTIEIREELEELLGPRLLPVWHSTSEGIYDNPSDLPAWRHLVATYPYVAIGGDRPLNPPLLRKLVRIAHANGTIVHGLGVTSPDVFRQVGWDTGDSTNWIAGMLYGRYGDFAYLRTGKNDLRTLGISRSALRWFESLGVDTETLLQSGKNIDKLRAGVIVELLRQAQLRKEGVNGRKPASTTR